MPRKKTDAPLREIDNEWSVTLIGSAVLLILIFSLASIT